MTTATQAPISLADLTPKQRAALLKDLNKQQKEDKKRLQKTYDAYKESVDKTVNNLFPSLQNASKMLATVKQLVYDKTHSLLAKKTELYETAAENQSHTFTNHAGDVSITIGYRNVDGWDDTVNEGIKIVKNYIAGVKKGAGDSDHVKFLKEVVDKLLSKDAQGNLKASRVLELKKVAEKITSKDLHKGISIIESAYKPKRTKNFVSVTFLDKEGKQCTLPLNMTDAEITIKES